MSRIEGKHFFATCSKDGKTIIFEYNYVDKGVNDQSDKNSQWELRQTLKSDNG